MKTLEAAFLPWSIHTDKLTLHNPTGELSQIFHIVYSLCCLCKCDHYIISRINVLLRKEITLPQEISQSHNAVS